MVNYVSTCNNSTENCDYLVIMNNQKELNPQLKTAYNKINKLIKIHYQKTKLTISTYCMYVIPYVGECIS